MGSNFPAFLPAGPHPGRQLTASAGVISDDGFHEVVLAGQEQLTSGLGGGDSRGRHQLGDGADGAGPDLVVADRLAHGTLGTWRRHQA